MAEGPDRIKRGYWRANGSRAAPDAAIIEAANIGDDAADAADPDAAII